METCIDEKQILVLWSFVWFGKNRGLRVRKLYLSSWRGRFCRDLYDSCRTIQGLRVSLFPIRYPRPVCAQSLTNTLSHDQYCRIRYQGGCRKVDRRDDTEGIARSTRLRARGKTCLDRITH